MNIQETIEKIKRQILIGECEKSIGIPVYISDLKTVLAELDKKDEIINEMAKSNVKLKGYEILDEYVENTVRFFTKKVENDERKKQANKIVRAIGHGQSECYECKKQGKYSLNWTSFLYRIEKDNYEHLYCYECAKKLESE